MDWATMISSIMQMVSSSQNKQQAQQQQKPPVSLGSKPEMQIANPYYNPMQMQSLNTQQLPARPQFSSSLGRYGGLR